MRVLCYNIAIEKLLSFIHKKGIKNIMRINSDDFINEMDNFGVDMPTDKEFDAVMGMADDIEKYLNEFGYIEIYNHS